VFMRETVSTTLTALQLLLNVTQVSNARLDLAGAAHRPHCGTGWANNSSSTCQGLPGPTENSSLLDRLTLCRAVNELFSSSCCRAPDIAPSHVTQAAAAAPNRHLSGRLPPTSALSVKHGRRLNGAAIACYTSIGGVLGLHNDSLTSMLCGATGPLTRPSKLTPKLALQIGFELVTLEPPLAAAVASQVGPPPTSVRSEKQVQRGCYCLLHIYMWSAGFVTVIH
jgi:hypothetical protein